MLSYCFMPLQQGNQPATSAPSTCLCKARFLQREKKVETVNWWLCCASQVMPGGGSTDRNYFVYLVFHVRRQGFQSSCCSRSGGSSFPLRFLLPRTARLHSPVRFFTAATLGNAGPEAEFSDIQHLSHPPFNATSDEATCIYRPHF